MSRISLLLVLVAIAVCLPAFAKKPVEQVVAANPADTPEKFEKLVASVRAEMAPEGRYEFLQGKDLETVNRTLDQMTALLVSSGSIAEMNDNELANMMTYQERVNGLLAGNADDRLVCTHEKPIGSHISRTQCYTVRQLKKSKEDMRDQKEILNQLGRRAPGEPTGRFSGKGPDPRWD